MTHGYKVILRAPADVGCKQVIKLFWEGVNDEEVGLTNVIRLLKLGGVQI